MKKILLLILTLFATSTLFAQTFTNNGINYNVTSPTTVEVGLNPNFIGNAVIPGSVNYANVDYEVTVIGNYAFHNCKTLISLTIPNSVTTISYSAFAACQALKSIIIPNSVTNIGDWAFAFCDSLASINIPYL